MSLGRKKVPFLNLPTPIEYLPNISRELGINLYLKRDDMTGLGMGGNKLRKLEYFLYDAQQREATMLLTTGSLQTNHGRLTAAVAAKYGLKCAIIVIEDKPASNPDQSFDGFTDNGFNEHLYTNPEKMTANVLLDTMMGAEVIVYENNGKDSLDKQYEIAVAAVKDYYENQGETVYHIPMGGSDELGMLGYYDCAIELTAQAADLGISDSRVITAVGSMGTYMGLFCGLKDTSSPLSLTGIQIMPYDESIRGYAKKYFDRIKSLYNLDFDANKSDFHIDDAYYYGEYNNSVPEVRESILKMARKEAIILDPCYTGKVFNAIRQMILDRKIQPGETIIMMHTGGAPGIYTPHHLQYLKDVLSDQVKTRNEKPDIND